MPDRRTIFAETGDSGKRVDMFLSAVFPEVSRNRIQSLLKSGDILVNQKDCKSNYKVKDGDEISVFFPESEKIHILPEDIPIKILYEDKEIIVIDKPKGMVVHPSPGHYTGTLVNALLYHCKGELSGINGKERPGIVHRIDKDTSGVLVAAKTDIAHRKLSIQLADHSITRVYYALVYNNIIEDEGVVDKPIARHPKDRKKMAVVCGGRYAVTRYRVLERFGKYTFIEARLKTGRTHQIRVHMSSIGHPLLGDAVYGPKNDGFKIEGQALHAGILGFIHPKTGEYIEFNSPLPEYFDKLISKLRNKH